MTTAREYHTATLLPNGKLLVTGGFSVFILASAEIYDPVANTWTATPNPMTAARRSHTASLMSNGKVLVVGGFGTNATYLASTEQYDDVSAASWTATNSMAVPRRQHTDRKSTRLNSSHL